MVSKRTAKLILWLILFIGVSTIQQQLFWSKNFLVPSSNLHGPYAAPTDPDEWSRRWKQVLAADTVLDWATKEGPLPSSAVEQKLKGLWKELVEQQHQATTAQNNNTSNGNIPSQVFVANVFVPSHSFRSSNNNNNSSSSIVLTTHGGASKLGRFMTQLEYWKGPASLAVYVNDGASQIDDLLQFVQTHMESLQNTFIHILMEYSSSNAGYRYPHNPLRNLALDYSGESNFFLAADIDLIPGPVDCHGSLQQSLHWNNGELMQELIQERRILVLPAFDVFAREGQEAAVPDQLPADKADLVSLVQKHHAEPFRYSRWRKGHEATNFPKWYQTSTDDSSGPSRFYEIHFEETFEPYVVAYRPGIPRYWKPFRGYGFNKASWFMELHRAGYTFGTATHEYMVHLQHASTRNTEDQSQNLPVMDDFIDYLDARYPVTSSTIRFEKSKPKPWWKRAWKRWTKPFRRTVV